MATVKKTADEVPLEQATLFGLLEETRDQADTEPKIGVEEGERKKRYYDAKTIVRTLEKNNDKRIYLFPSATGKQGEWYLMGGNSALFYKYFLGPRMGRKPIIRRDTDARCTFKYGTSVIHWIENFIQKAEKLECTATEMEFGIIVVEMQRRFTVGEIKNLYQLEKEDGEKLVMMIKPLNNYPKLYAELRALIRYLGPKVSRMPVSYRQNIGNEILLAGAKLFKYYFKTANGDVSVTEGVEKMLEIISDMKALLAVIDELMLFDPTTRTRIGEYILDIVDAIKEYKERNGKTGQTPDDESGEAGAESQTAEKETKKNSNN